MGMKTKDGKKKSNTLKFYDFHKQLLIQNLYFHKFRDFWGSISQTLVSQPFTSLIFCSSKLCYIIGKVITNYFLLDSIW